MPGITIFIAVACHAKSVRPRAEDMSHNKCAFQSLYRAKIQVHGIDNIFNMTLGPLCNTHAP